MDRTMRKMNGLICLLAAGVVLRAAEPETAGRVLRAEPAAASNAAPAGESPSAQGKAPRDMDPEASAAESTRIEEERARVLCEHSKLVTQDADPLGAGAWQLQINGTYNRTTQQWDAAWDRSQRELAFQKSGQIALTYGVSNHLDLAVASGYSRVADGAEGPRPGRGATDLALSAKWRFFERDARGIAAAFVPTLTIPTGARTTGKRLGPSQEFWSFDARFALVKDWENGWSANADAGYVAIFGERGDARGGFGANAAVGYRLHPKVQPSVELSYNHAFVRGGDIDLVAMTVGSDFPLSPHACIRAGVQHGIAGRNSDRPTTFLLSVDFNF